MARYWIDESLIVNGEYLDRGFILDTDTQKIEWTEPIQNGATHTFDISECVYNDDNENPVSLEDGKGIGIPEEEYFTQFKREDKMTAREFLEKCGYDVNEGNLFSLTQYLYCQTDYFAFPDAAVPDEVLTDPEMEAHFQEWMDRQ